jgi:hypothetical protein
VLVAGVATGVLAGLESPANGFGLGVSAVVMLLDSAGFLRLPNRLLEVAEAFSCAGGACDVAPNPLKGVEVVFVGVGRFANGLLAGTDAGVLVLDAAAFEVPNRLVDGAVVGALSAFCAVVPKLNKFEAGAVAAALGVSCALVPNPLKILV